MASIWQVLMEEFISEFDNDVIIEQLVADILVNDVEEIDDASYPMKEDGSGPRKVRRYDYSRGTKEEKSNEDPATALKWMRWVGDPAVADPSTRQGKRFRRLFRVPFPIFEYILSSCKESGDELFCYAVKDCCGVYSIPLEVKILFAFRVMAGGTKIEDAAEMSNFMSKSEGNTFFKAFVVKFCQMFEHIHIRPLEGEELLTSMRTYARIGLPGCIGSIDATFVPWDRVPKHMHNECDGDKGVGVLFEVIVTHEKLILAVGGPWAATINDKISVRYSQFMQLVRSRKIAENVKYKIRTGRGENDFIELTAVYVVADGGYLDWPEIMSGYGLSSDPAKYRFTDWVASVRKDVECLFGILKI